MPTYDVKHQDGRTTRVLAPDETAALGQANHQEMLRATIAVRTNTELNPPLSMALSAVEWHKSQSARVEKPENILDQDLS